MEIKETFACCVLQQELEKENIDEVGYAILAITSGEGNGWQFSADVLQVSLPLWEGVQCFVDHHLTPGRPFAIWRGFAELQPGMKGSRELACDWNLSVHRRAY